MPATDDKILLSAEWIKDGTEVTTGTATVEIIAAVGADAVWLQADLSTLSATPATLTLTYDADAKWSRILTVPVSLDGLDFLAWYRHSDSELPPADERFPGAAAASSGGGLTVDLLP